MSNVPDVLSEIVKKKESEVKKLYRSSKAKEYESLALKLPYRRFYAVITKPIVLQGHFNLIAEFKKASPSAGKIRPYARPEGIAKLYERCGASAISVLTDSHFDGELNHLERIRYISNLPLLRKDFIIDSAQIYESRVFGADAILLIAAILESTQIRDFIWIADSLSLDCLVEIHDESEIEKAVKGNARIFGINNRNLHNFRVDRQTTLRLLKYIPYGYPIVTESGILKYEHVKELMHPRVNAMLVGEAIMSKELNPELKDMENKIYELLGKRS